MTNKIVSFEEFSKKAHHLVGEDTILSSEDGEETMGSSEGGHHQEQHYMFFQNLASIKHYIEEILVLNPAEIDELLKNGHDWASDHIATSKDDIQEVAEWLRNELSSEGHHEETEDHEEEPENIVVDVEGDNDEVEVEDDKEEDEDKEEEDEDEE
jgi:hypothetical protein